MLGSWLCGGSQTFLSCREEAAPAGLQRAVGTEHAQCWAWCRAPRAPQLCVRPSPCAVGLQLHLPQKCLTKRTSHTILSCLLSKAAFGQSWGAEAALQVAPLARRAAPSFPSNVPQDRLSCPLNQRGKQNNEQLMQGGLWSTQNRRLQRSQAQP